jgi:hypothetical protein
MGNQVTMREGALMVWLTSSWSRKVGEGIWSFQRKQVRLSIWTGNVLHSALPEIMVVCGQNAPGFFWVGKRIGINQWMKKALPEETRWPRDQPWAEAVCCVFPWKSAKQLMEIRFWVCLSDSGGLGRTQEESINYQDHGHASDTSQMQSCQPPVWEKRHTEVASGSQGSKPSWAPTPWHNFKICSKNTKIVPRVRQPGLLYRLQIYV